MIQALAPLGAHYAVMFVLDYAEHDVTATVILTPKDEKKLTRRTLQVKAPADKIDEEIAAQLPGAVTTLVARASSLAEQIAAQEADDAKAAAKTPSPPAKAPPPAKKSHKKLPPPATPAPTTTLTEEATAPAPVAAPPPASDPQAGLFDLDL